MHLKKYGIVALLLLLSITFGTLSYIFMQDSESRPESKSLFKYSELLPDVEDDDVEIINQDGGGKYAFRLYDVSQQYYYDYCYSLKENGFIDVEYETNVSFGAYDNDGKYWVEAHFYNTDGSNILVIVQEAKNYKEKGE